MSDAPLASFTDQRIVCARQIEADGVTPADDFFSPRPFEKVCVIASTPFSHDSLASSFQTVMQRRIVPAFMIALNAGVFLGLLIPRGGTAQSDRRHNILPRLPDDGISYCRLGGL